MSTIAEDTELLAQGITEAINLHVGYGVATRHVRNRNVTERLLVDPAHGDALAFVQVGENIFKVTVAFYCPIVAKP